MFEVNCKNMTFDTLTSPFSCVLSVLYVKVTFFVFGLGGFPSLLTPVPHEVFQEILNRWDFQQHLLNVKYGLLRTPKNMKNSNYFFRDLAKNLILVTFLFIRREIRPETFCSIKKLSWSKLFMVNIYNRWLWKSFFLIHVYKFVWAGLLKVNLYQQIIAITQTR